MSKKEKDYQEAIWELLRSEVLYMEKLHVISDLFISALEEVHSEHILVEVNKQKLFGKLEQVLEAHKYLWLNYLQPVVQKARDREELINATNLCEGIFQVGCKSDFMCVRTD